MSGTRFGVIVAVPDADGFGLVAFGDAQRRIYFAPERFTSAEAVAAGWPTPQAGDTVEIVPGTPQDHAKWIVKKGSPAYTYTAGA
jgi:hypothetical protein